MATSQSPQHVVVIGAGMVGLSTAWFLQREGVEVTVVDRYDVAAGASWGNAGWLAPALTLPLPEPAILATGVRAALSPSSPVYVPLSANPRLLRFLVGFARHCTDKHWRRAMGVFNEANAVALDAYAEMAGAPGDVAVDAPTKPATPFLAAFASEADREVLVEEFRRVNAAGGSTDYTLLDHDAVHALEPALGDGVQCGVTMNGQRYINPGEFVHALAGAVKTGGGQVVTGRSATAVTQRGDRAEVRFSDGSTIDADAVVVANGTWLGQLARPHGVRTIVQAGRGYSFTVHPDEAPRNPLYLPRSASRARRSAGPPTVSASPG